MDAIGKSEFPNCRGVYKTVHPETQECRWCALGLLAELTVRKYPHLVQFADCRKYAPENLSDEARADYWSPEKDGSWHQMLYYTRDVNDIRSHTPVGDAVLMELFPELGPEFSGKIDTIIGLNDDFPDGTDNPPPADWENAAQLKHVIEHYVIFAAEHIKR